jgi:hypothetical protein
MTVQSLASRFHWLEKPAALPAKCVVCGAVDHPVVDFNFSMEYYGVVYFCESCLGEAARVIGFVAPQDLTTDNLGIEQSVNKYLTENDLVAVPRDFINMATDSVHSLSNVFATIVYDLPMANAHKESGTNEYDPEHDVTGAAESDGSVG